MSQKNAKIIITLIIFILILFGFIYYYFFLKDTTSETTPNIDETTGLFPSGQGVATSSTNTSGEIEGFEDVLVPKYRKISQKPMSGSVITTIEDDKKGSAIRYIDRATGHIYETWTKSIEQERISNTTIPKVYETFWSASGDSFIARYVDEETENIISFYAKLIKKDVDEKIKSDTHSLDGSFLQENITSMFLSSSGKNLFYVLDKKNSSSIIKSELETNRNLELLNSPLREWLVGQFGNNYILKTKPTYKTGGFIYKLDNNGNLFKLLGNINGLTALEREDGTAFLYSVSTDNSFNLNVFQTNGAKTAKLSKKTLPEKCAWSKKNKSIIYCAIPTSIPFNKYPDEWYQGIVSFDDTIWIIDTNLSLGSVIADPEMYSEPSVDGINLMLSENEDYLIFTNKKDYSLWGIDLTPEKLSESSAD